MAQQPHPLGRVFSGWVTMLASRGVGFIALTMQWLVGLESDSLLKCLGDDDDDDDDDDDGPVRC